MRIAIYSRKSVYTGKGESIENQIELCRQYLIRHQYEWQESDLLVYEEEGFSGKDGKRPQFQKMLQDMRQKNLIVWSAIGWIGSAGMSAIFLP